MNDTIEKIQMHFKIYWCLLWKVRDQMIQLKLRDEKFRNLDMLVKFLESTTETYTAATENNLYGLDGEGEDSDSKYINSDVNNLI